MSIFSLPWPALEGGSLPHELRCERAVWGKVHGAASDYRWIARSPGLRDRGSHLAAALNLGSEDQVQRAPFWRVFGEICLAGVFYPSRAQDAFGRAAKIEKQLLWWQRPPEIPAALGALVLLSRIFAGGDELWWKYAGDPAWTDMEFSLELPLEDAPAPSQESLGALIERGRQQVAELLAPLILESFYVDLLEGRRPALLGPLARPLGPEGLAALLLPLPRQLADSLSLAGWLPSSRFDLASLGQRWSGLCVPNQPPTRATETLERSRQDAWAMAQAVRAEPGSAPIPLEELLATLSWRQPLQEPQIVHSAGAPGPTAPSAEPPPARPAASVLPRPFPLLPLTAPLPDSPAIVQALYEWARDPYRRQREPLERILQPRRSARITLGSDLRSICQAWPDEVRRNPPEGASLDQWDEKVKLLEAKVGDLLRLAR